MRGNKRLTVIIILILVALGYYWFQNKQVEKNNENEQTTSSHEQTERQRPKLQPNSTGKSIDQLTDEIIVIEYLKKHGKLPDYYITKRRARERGWVASKGNLCNVLPGKAIGGDVFTNRQKILPSKNNRIWYEADLNYNCGRRNADRILFSSDKLIFVTKDHYKTFEEK